MAKWKPRNSSTEPLNGVDKFTKTVAISMSRRGFLTKATIFGALLGLGGPTSKAAFAAQWQTDTSVGPYALREGVIGYNITQTSDGVNVQFTHVDSSKAGVLRVRRRGISQDVSLELARPSSTLFVTMNLNTDSPYLIAKRDTSSEARFVFERGQWRPKSSDARMIIETNLEDIKLGAAIYADFEPQPPSSKAASPNVVTANVTTDATLAASCPCSATNKTVRGTGSSSARSYACQKAIDDANKQCTNQWCFGCCGWISPEGTCDCGCLAGDYICTCGKAGRYCTGRCS